MVSARVIGSRSPGGGGGGGGEGRGGGSGAREGARGGVRAHVEEGQELPPAQAPGARQVTRGDHVLRHGFGRDGVRAEKCAAPGIFWWGWIGVHWFRAFGGAVL